MLKKIDSVDFSKLQTFEEVTAAAGNSEMVHQLEEVLMIWYKQIEQVSGSNDSSGVVVFMCAFAIAFFSLKVRRKRIFFLLDCFLKLGLFLAVQQN